VRSGVSQDIADGLCPDFPAIHFHAHKIPSMDSNQATTSVIRLLDTANFAFV